MIIDPVRSNSTGPTGAAPTSAARQARPPQSANTVVIRRAPDAPDSAPRPAAPVSDAAKEIKQLKPPLNAIMAQLGGQALLGAELLRGVSVADLGAALGRGLVKPGSAMRATAASLQQVLGAVDAKA